MALPPAQVAYSIALINLFFQTTVYTHQAGVRAPRHCPTTASQADPCAVWVRRGYRSVGNCCCWRDSKAAVRKQTRHSLAFQKACLQFCTESLAQMASRANQHGEEAAWATHQIAGLGTDTADRLGVSTLTVRGAA